jgi:hypothetical protein
MWGVLCMYLLIGVMEFTVFSKMEYHVALAFLYLGVVAVQLFVISRLRKRLKNQFQRQDIEGDGGRQRT